MIELLLLDVDGTLSDGKIHISGENEVFKSFCVKDGLGLAYWNNIGKISAIITGRDSKIIEKRARELGVAHIFMNVKNKGQIARDLKRDLGLDSSQIAAIGDDMNDISMFNESSLNFIPNNASSSLKALNIARILHSNGGDGAVREAIEYILKQDGIYEKFIQYWK